MNREDVINRIKPHEAALRAAGLASLYLFGSTARDEADDDSDVDFSCELDAGRTLGLFDFFRIQHQLEQIVGHSVDLVETEYLLPVIAARASKDLVRVF